MKYTVIFVWIYIFSVNGNAFDIVSISPSPNYELTKDVKDNKQLSDKRLSDWPMWKYKNAVGFSNRSPISIEGSLKTIEKFNRVEVHVSKGLFAGVYLPKSIDVYCKINRDWNHVGGKLVDGENYNDRDNHWVVIDIDTVCNNDFKLIFHAGGDYFILDEIKLIYSNDIKIKEKIKFTVNNIKQNSINRLKEIYQKEHDRNVDKYVNGIYNEGVVVKIRNAWGRLSTDFKKRNSLAHENIYRDVFYVPFNGVVDFSLEIVNVGNDNAGFELVVEEVKEISINSIQPVLTANGKSVYDVLIPVESIDLPASKPQYYLVSINALQLHSDYNELTLKIMSKKNEDSLFWKKKILVHRVRNYFSTPLVKPKVTVWSYTSDQPIWKNNHQVLRKELVDSGVNIQFIHHSKIPGLKESFHQSKKYRKLVSEVGDLKGSGLLVFYLHWEKLNRNNFIYLARWLKSFSEFMIEQGLSYKDWALYPVDEINRRKFRKSLEIYAEIKEINPSVQLYVNPEGRGRNVLTISQLNELLPYVNFWQPQAGDSVNVFKDFAAAAGLKHWWIYDNGKSPAKLKIPMCYRALGKEAFDQGATGFGFWSFSDTGGSSALDDFDGYRPDWAVVYERSGSFYSSRRWEAFKRGITDYSYMATCKNSSDNWKEKKCAKYYNYLQQISCDDYK